MVSARSITSPYVAAVHEDTAEALLEDTVDVSQLKGDGENVFHVQRLDAQGRTEASATKYMTRALERQAARADRTRPKKYRFSYFSDFRGTFVRWARKKLNGPHVSLFNKGLSAF